jgi:hypothetical protein
MIAGVSNVTKRSRSPWTPKVAQPLEAAMTGTLLENYLSEERFAAELGVSIRTLRNWRQRRTGPPFATIGKKIVYGKSSGLAWLQSQERHPLRKRASR